MFKKIVKILELVGATSEHDKNYSIRELKFGNVFLNDLNRYMNQNATWEEVLSTYLKSPAVAMKLTQLST